MEFNNSDDLCQYMAERTGGLTVLSFSGGKDSLACWLQLQRFFDRIIPFYMYLVPGLEFVERGLQYYEETFGTRIIRLPHPSLYRMLNQFTFQAPENCHVIEGMNLPNFDYDDLYRVIKEDYDLPDEVFTALGVRAVDSPNRWAAMKRYGPVNEKRQVFYPIYDWRKAQLMGAINQAGLKLPPDYVMFGRSFDGIDYRFLEPMKRHYPRDYERVLEFFPLADLELFRIECRRKWVEQ